MIVLFSTLSFANQDELNGVKNEISRQKSAVTSQQKELNKLQQSLKKQELSISSLGKEITKTQTLLNQANKNLAQFTQQKSDLEQTKKEQQQTLEQLIRTYYVIKRSNDTTGIIKHGQDEQQDRISQYFQHLAKARAETIQALDLTSKQLDEKNKQLLQEQQQIQALLAQKTKKRDALAQSQNERKKTVTKIQSNISSDKHYLAELQRNESRLRSEIAKAAKRNTVPMDGLAKQKGKLPWPLKGKVLHSYGTKQSGQINWKGLVIDAQYEQPVKAVYSGTVVFAEYLRGYGLVVLLDHGKGDMTLYGYNQTLLKIEGDKVKAGETIALAGNTGGQPQASLYFEIRRNSKTQNPKSWLVR
ncbi:peptidoglycan DD-metalloendopeptidase family protein [Vibrio sp. TH_r3]|uniref:murein hydrolase activator EnvC family protein n=1 Tax=Vibrio sp. TH_r3 TaxID=3082084 RepID=UPI0029556DCC|nr:peptidoglycan DD-metalloendopeptidase family protein [Vibrio sp. TH_r3]MDV7104224.1 peptidoglycan DD-metalloendopeptidase family protein [Vibrio sp. TH_r3]